MEATKAGVNVRWDSVGLPRASPPAAGRQMSCRCDFFATGSCDTTPSTKGEKLKRSPSIRRPLRLATRSASGEHPFSAPAKAPSSFTSEGEPDAEPTVWRVSEAWRAKARSPRVSEGQGWPQRTSGGAALGSPEQPAGSSVSPAPARHHSRCTCRSSAHESRKAHGHAACLSRYRFLRRCLAHHHR
jgi:hypothetical protein